MHSDCDFGVIRKGSEVGSECTSGVDDVTDFGEIDLGVG